MDKTLILNKIKEFKNFKSDAEFARYLEIPPQNLSKWKRRNTYDTELIYTKCTDLNPEWLLTGKGEMLKQKTPIQNDISSPKVITITPNNEDNIVLVPVKAQAGYLNGYDDPQFIQKLPSYNLPNMRNGIFRMFQVEGHSMYPTMHSNSYVVGQFVEDWVNDIKDNRIYVIVTADGVVVKRVLNRIEKYGNIYCKSDNRKEYPSYPVEPSQIKEIWECKMLLSYDFLDPAEIYDRVSDLEAKVLHLEHLHKLK